MPRWMWLVIILCMAPGLSLPVFTTLTQSSEATVRTLVWLYPVYVAISGLLAWQCYGRRTLLTWIILILLLLSHACFYYLAFATYRGY